MTIKEQLLNEIENIPTSMLEEILDFVQFIKAKQSRQNFMDFAGMSGEIDEVMQEIVEEAEANRKLDLDRAGTGKMSISKSCSML